MPPTGEKLFSFEIFDAINGSCPNYKYTSPLSEVHHGFYIGERLPQILHAAPYAIFWFVLRKMCKSHLPDAISKLTGVKGRKKMREKISYQAWLMLYYAVSTCLGAWGYQDEPWFQFPLGHNACFGMFGNHPAREEITPFMEWSYQFQLGFYFAELFAIFNEPRRSDFAEYVVHHCTTITLVMFSSIIFHIRVGCYIFFIHDIPDIFLCAAKIYNYLKKELIANALFAVFVFTFAFNRLICLPSVSYCIFCNAPGFTETSVTYQILSYLLCFLLQGLHVFWFALIVRMIVRLAIGVREDCRSDDDDEDEAVSDKKKKNKNRELKEKEMKTLSNNNNNNNATLDAEIQKLGNNSSKEEKPVSA